MTNKGQRMKRFLAAFLTAAICCLVIAAGASAQVLTEEERGSLQASTFLGGSSLGADGFEYVEAMAADADGNIYLVGCTDSQDFPVTTGSYDNFPTYDIFVAKMNSDLTELLASTVIGGSGWEF
ncbi:MAG: hypothetical protein PHO01_06360 [Desulfotomaculaceae bacterium]|nr:hypothetical protein [Desulfotomaculaceae bacterium]